MNDKSLRVLERPKVKELVDEKASFSLGREAVLQLSPKTALTEVVQELKLTSDAVRLLWKHGDAPFGGAADIRQVVGRSQLGGILDADQFLRPAQ